MNLEESMSFSPEALRIRLDRNPEHPFIRRIRVQTKETIIESDASYLAGE